MTTKPKGGRGPKRKGARYETEIAEWYNCHGIRAERTKRAQGRRRGGADVTLVDLPGFHVECKHYRSGGLAVRAWLQANAECIGFVEPIVHIHEDQKLPGRGSPHLVVISRDLWMRVLEAYLNRKE